MALAWPSGFYPRDILFDPINVSRSGGVSTNGEEQIVGSGVGKWSASLRAVPVADDNAVLSWRAFRASLRGRARTVIVPAFEVGRANWPVDPYGRVLSPSFTRHPSLDGTPYADPAIPAASAVTATFGAAATRRATTVTINVSQGAPIKVGQYFSTVPGRLYVIDGAVNANTFTIWPPLRDAVGAGQSVNLTTPSCEMRLSSDDSGSLELQLGRWGFVDLEWVEA